MRQQLRVIGVGDEQLARVLRNIHALADWPYAWEAEGDRHAAAHDWSSAAIAYYLGQRPLLTYAPLKRRLHRLALDAYQRAEHVTTLERVEVTSPAGETIVGYLQVPPRTPAPLIVMVPGVSSMKEELHVFAEPLVARGYAVARIDNPYYGETSGVLDDAAQFHAADVGETLRKDPRIDAEQVHLFGMSLGAHFVLNSASRMDCTSVIVVAPAYDPTAFLDLIPTSNATAVATMMGAQDWAEVEALGGKFAREGRAQDIRCPVRLIHGGRDRTIPISESWRLVDELTGPVALLEFPRAHHNCLEHYDEMIVDILEWLHDPTPAIRAFARDMRRMRAAQHEPRAQAPAPRSDETSFEPGMA